MNLKIPHAIHGDYWKLNFLLTDVVSNADEEMAKLVADKLTRMTNIGQIFAILTQCI